MNFQIKIDNKIYHSDLSKGKSIAITLLPNGKQPNHFGAPECTSETLIAGDFIGDTKRGGSCNVNQLTIIPHCNGTHTESISHIVDELVAVHSSIQETLFPCAVVTIRPTLAVNNQDQYKPSIDEDNLIITKSSLQEKLKVYTDVQLQGLVIRTKPNLPTKKSATYDAKNYPAFLTNDAMSYLVKRKVKHLMVDFPSVDKMYDDGLLSNHHIFWNVALGTSLLSSQSKINKTITEMVFVEDSIDDGFYLCNLQVPEINTDAVPSRPELFQLTTK